MPKPREGSAFWHVDHYDIQITLPDGSRSKRVCQPVGMSEAMAREKAKRWTELAVREGGTAAPGRARRDGPPPATECFADWWERWCDARKTRGLTSAETDRSRGRKWILDLGGLGPRAMGALTRADVENWVEWIDSEVRRGKLSWRTAGHAWGIFSKAMKDASSGKAKDLRVLKENPAAGVAPPDRGAVKSKTFLYPSEFSALVACARVPLRWRQIFAVATYLYVRAGELEALEWEDVDIDQRIVHVHRAIDRIDGETKATKTDTSRRLPIEPELVPLLEAMKKGVEGGRVVEMPPLEDLAERLRKYLRWAGVTRAELFTTDATRKQIVFHDLRATGITWLALRGEEPMRIMRRAGHKEFKTTLGYVREAEALGDVGTPFPPLPEAICESLRESLQGPAEWGLLRKNTWEKRGVPSGIRSPRQEASMQDLPRDRAVSSGGGGEPGGPKSAEHGPQSDSGAIRGPRLELVEGLLGALRAGMLSGDVEAARVAYDALGKLLPDGSRGAPVVDLAAERRRR